MCRLIPNVFYLDLNLRFRVCRATAMSNSEINQLSHREANLSPDPSGQPPPIGWQGAICATLRQRQGRTQQRFAIARFFKFQEYRTTIRIEVLAGITTFMTMAYIVVVNPGILSDAIFLQKSGDLFNELVLTSPLLKREWILS